MQAFKKFMAIVAMILSALTIIALIAGIIGSWFVNAQLRVTGTNLLLTGETSLVTVRQGLDRADSLLSLSISGLTEIETRAGQIGAVVTENNIIVDGVLQRLNVDIEPALTRATDNFQLVEANLMAIDEAIAAIDAIPFMRFNVGDVPGINLIGETLDMMQKLRDDVRGFIAGVQQQRNDIVNGTKALVVDPARDLNARLQNVATHVTDTNMQLATLQTQMASLRERLPAILNWITIILNIFFAWSILAFASLFTHAWQYHKCPDDGLRGLLPPERCASERLPATVIKPAGAKVDL
jgi:uncharacterized protein YoxC